MAGNSFGTLFKISTYGESHGRGVGVVIDGCPAGLDIDISFIQNQLDRRRPGQSSITTQRKESDTVQVLSGVFQGKSLGTPISMLIPNEDQRSLDYDHNKDIFRPSHADFTYEQKYGIRDHRGGGRSSARETAARVAAGAVAKMFIEKTAGIKIYAYVSRVGKIILNKSYEELDVNKIDSNIIRCPDEEVSSKMISYIDNIRKDGDTVGGVISCVCINVPAGLGDPVFDKLHADIAKAVLSINAAHGFEYGSGFRGAEMKGSKHNDIFNKDFSTKTNHSGGIQGGISNGAPVCFNVAFKPIATIMKEQETIDKYGNQTLIKGRGRHDPCVLPRAVPIVESMTALVMADHLLRNKICRL